MTLHPKIKVYWNDMSIANAGVVFQEAKEEKAVYVVNENRLILFLFRLFYKLVEYIATTSSSSSGT